MMLQCVIVDDDNSGIEVLKKYIDQAPGLELTESFRNPLKALAFLEENDIDIAFLDINMPELDGLKLAKLLRKKNIKTIFCTAYSEYALESYELSAVDYLLKPIPFDRFLEAVAKVQDLLKRKNSEPSTRQDDKNHLFIKCGSTIHRVKIEDLLYMKKDGHYFWINTRKESLFSRMSMSELLDILPENNFVQVHRSFVIAIDKITLLERHHLIINNEEIPIGSNFRKELMDKINYSGT